MPDYSKYRSMLHHLALIDEAVRGAGYPNTTTLARDLELSARTIGRKIEFMRDVLGAPLAYDAAKRGYYYTEPSWSLPNIRITEGELLGLAMSQMALSAYRGTPLESYLKQVAEKLEACLPEPVDVKPVELEGMFRFSLGPVAPFDPEVWEKLATAARERRTIEMRYYIMSKDETADRTVDPYLLRCYSGNWYLIGHDYRSGNIPMFSLARIRRLKVTNRRFQIRADFQPDDYLSGTFGVMESKHRDKVRILFTGLGARVIEERVWHPTQKVSRRRDGSVVLEMTIADLHEVGRWILSWGACAKAIEPKELVEFVQRSAQEVCMLYDGAAAV